MPLTRQERLTLDGMMCGGVLMSSSGIFAALFLNNRQVFVILGGFILFMMGAILGGIKEVRERGG